MAMLSSVAVTVTLSDGTVSLTKPVPAVTWTGTSGTYTSGLSVGTGSTTITLPVTAPQTVYIRNLAPAGVSAPVSAPTLGQVAGGTNSQTTYYVKITYINLMGETTPSSESSLLVLANQVLTVTSPPALGSATSYNVYVSTTTNTETLQNTSPIAIGTNWTEPTSGLVSGAALPGSNTTAAVVTVTWTKQGGSSAAVMDLIPGADIAFSEPTSAGGFNAPSAKGGVTALSLQSSIAATTCELIVSG